MGAGYVCLYWCVVIAVRVRVGACMLMRVCACVCSFTAPEEANCQFIPVLKTSDGVIIRNSTSSLITMVILAIAGLF